MMPALLPLEDGEQYRFTFAMDVCVGCHSCEVACAEQNGRPVGGAWRRVGELEGGAFPSTRRYSLSIACNHCLEPTCLSGCPTKAYEKLGNGLVVHHADDCVGCKYCMWNCPYEVPVFDEAHKVVSKCDLCRPRLEQGQSPACVLACPTRAIGVEPVNVAAWRADPDGADAPGLPPASITRSTTRIEPPAAASADLVAVDDHRFEPEEPHWPLIALTLLTQVSLGTVGAATLLQLGGVGAPGVAVAAFVAGAVALAASLLHLGRPDRALKAFRNVRTSWLSREVALFTLFSALSFGYAVSQAVLFGAAASVVGIAGVYASARLYRVPARPVWNSGRTSASFFATVTAAGPLLALLCLDRGRVRPAWIAALLAVSAAGVVAQLAAAAHLRATLRRRTDRQHRGTAALLARFPTLRFVRTGGALGALALAASALAAPLAGPAAGGRIGAALVVAAAAELAGRYLFYVTVVPYRIAGSW